MHGQLAPCTFWWACVSSRSDAAARHRIEPLAVTGDPYAAFGRLKRILASEPRAVIVSETDDYVHAACRTRIGFVDDLECRLCPANRVIHIRSKSRIGAYDFGANRRRIERLRRTLATGRQTPEQSGPRSTASPAGSGQRIL